MKKFISYILLVAMLITSLPMTAFAGDPGTDGKQQSDNNPGDDSGKMPSNSKNGTMGIVVGACYLRDASGNLVTTAMCPDKATLASYLESYNNMYYSSPEIGGKLYIKLYDKNNGVPSANAAYAMDTPPAKGATGGPFPSLEGAGYIVDDLMIQFAWLCESGFGADMSSDTYIQTPSGRWSFSALGSTVLYTALCEGKTWAFSEAVGPVKAMFGAEQNAPIVLFCAESYVTVNDSNTAYTCADLTGADIRNKNVSGTSAYPNISGDVDWRRDELTVDKTLGSIRSNPVMTTHAHPRNSTLTQAFFELYGLNANENTLTTRYGTFQPVARYLNHTGFVDFITGSGSVNTSSDTILGTYVVAQYIDPDNIDSGGSTPKAAFTWNLDSQEIPLAGGHEQDNSKLYEGANASISGHYIGLCDFKFQTGDDAATEADEGSLALWNAYLTNKYPLTTACHLEFTPKVTSNSVDQGLVTPSIEGTQIISNDFTVKDWLNALNTGKSDNINLCWKYADANSNSNHIIEGHKSTWSGADFSDTKTRFFVEYEIPTMQLVVSGETFNLTNDQIHSATYEYLPEIRTYHLWQQTANAYAQIKADEIGESKWDAMAGVPTTENLFVSMGGSEFIVNFQYRYCVDDYIRKYNVDVLPTPNYLYFKAGRDSYDPGVQKVAGSNFKQDSAPQKVDIGTKADPDDDFGDSTNAGYTKKARQEQYDKFKEYFTDYAEAICETLNNVDHNAAVNSYGTSYGVYASGEGSFTFSWPEGIKYNGGTDCTAFFKGHDQNMRNKSATALKSFIEKFNDHVMLIEKVQAAGGSGAHLADDLKQSKEVVLFSADKQYLDADSGASGAVLLSLSYSGERAMDYEEPTDRTHEYKFHDKGSGIVHPGHSAAGSNQVQCSGWKCPEVTGKHMEGNDGCEGSGGPCTATIQVADPTPDDPSHTKDESCGATWSRSHTDSTGHTHFGHKRTGSGNVNYNSGDELWEAATYEKHDPKYTPWEAWNASVHCTLSVDYNYSNGLLGQHVEIAHDAGTGRAMNKNLEYKQSFQQVFAGVKYMDIVECNVYRLSGGFVQLADGVNGRVGLENILGGNAWTNVVDQNRKNEVLTLACASKGFQLLDIEREYSYSSGDTTDKHKGEENTSVWYREPGTGGDAGADSDAPETYQSLNPAAIYTGKQNGVWRAINATDLAAIGRVSNTFEIAAEKLQAQHQGATHNINRESPNIEHGFKVDSTGDVMTFTYDPNTQGGRSHASFSGFVKQALALTFYDEESTANRVSREAIDTAVNPYTTAFRNYLLVESDFLMMEGNNMLGFQYDTSFLDSTTGAGSDLQAQMMKYGLSQSLLSTGGVTHTDPSADIFTYLPCASIKRDKNKGQEYWAIHDLTEITNQSEVNHGDAGANNVAQGLCTDVVSKFGSDPNTQVLDIGFYLEGREGGQNMQNTAGLILDGLDPTVTGATETSIIIAMEMDPRYAAWTPLYINGQYTMNPDPTPTAGMHDEDTFLSNITGTKRQLEDKNAKDSRMDQVGYKGGGDASEAGHDMKPTATVTSPMNVSNTYVYGSYQFKDSLDSTMNSVLSGAVKFNGIALAAAVPKLYHVGEGHELLSGTTNATLSNYFAGTDKADPTGLGTVSTQDMTAWFPYHTGFNTWRTKENGTYGGYNTALLFERVVAIDHTDKYFSIAGMADKTLQAFKNDNDPSVDQVAKKRVDVSGAELNPKDSKGNPLLGSVVNAAIMVPANYSFMAPNNTYSGHVTNPVQIYNPVATEFVSYLDSSKYLPDGTNHNGKDGEDSYGYGIRDTRLSTRYISNSATKDSYIFTEEIEEYPSMLSRDTVTYKLKIPSVIKTTTFTDTDTVQVDETIVTEVSTIGDALIDQTGSYTVRVNDGTNAFEFDTVLSAGDVLTWDGESLFLTTKFNSASNATFGNMYNVVVEYWNKKLGDVVENHEVDIDALVIKEKAEAQFSLIDIALKYTLLEGATYDTAYLTALNSVVEAINTVVTDLNAKSNTEWSNTETADVLYDIIARVTAYREKINALLDDYAENAKFTVDEVQVNAPTSLETTNPEEFTKLLEDEEFGYVTEQSPSEEVGNEDYKLDGTKLSWYKFAQEYPTDVTGIISDYSVLETKRKNMQSTVLAIKNNIREMNADVDNIREAYEDMDVAKELLAVQQERYDIHSKLIAYSKSQRSAWGANVKTHYTFTFGDEVHEYDLSDCDTVTDLVKFVDTIADNDKWQALWSEWKSYYNDYDTCMYCGRPRSDHSSSNKCPGSSNRYFKSVKDDARDEFKAFREDMFPTLAFETDKVTTQSPINPSNGYDAHRREVKFDYFNTLPNDYFIKKLVDETSTKAAFWQTMADMLADEGHVREQLFNAAIGQLDDFENKVSDVDICIDDLTKLQSADYAKIEEYFERINDDKTTVNINAADITAKEQLISEEWNQLKTDYTDVTTQHNTYSDRDGKLDLTIKKFNDKYTEYTHESSGAIYDKSYNYINDLRILMSDELSVISNFKTQLNNTKSNIDTVTGVNVFTSNAGQQIYKEVLDNSADWVANPLMPVTISTELANGYGGSALTPNNNGALNYELENINTVQLKANRELSSVSKVQYSESSRFINMLIHREQSLSVKNDSPSTWVLNPNFGAVVQVPVQVPVYDDDGNPVLNDDGTQKTETVYRDKLDENKKPVIDKTEYIQTQYKEGLNGKVSYLEGFYYEDTYKPRDTIDNNGNNVTVYDRTTGLKNMITLINNVWVQYADMDKESDEARKLLADNSSDIINTTASLNAAIQNYVNSCNEMRYSQGMVYTTFNNEYMSIFARDAHDGIYNDLATTKNSISYNYEQIVLGKRTVEHGVQMATSVISELNKSPIATPKVHVEAEAAVHVKAPDANAGGGHFDCPAGAVMTFGIGLTAKAGSVLTMSFPVRNWNGEGVDASYTPRVKVNASSEDAFNSRVTLENNTLKVQVEAKETATLTNIEFNFSKDLRFVQFNDNFITLERTWLLSSGNPVGELNYTSNFDYGLETSPIIASGKLSLNKYVYDASGENIRKITTTSLAKLQIVRTTVTGNTTNPTSDASNPHKVPNVNWKYYLVGTYVNNGTHMVTSMSDPVLNVDSTILPYVRPDGTNWTIGDVKADGGFALALYEGDWHLTTAGQGLQHRLIDTNIVPEQFDIFTLGYIDDLQMDAAVTIEPLQLLFGDTYITRDMILSNTDMYGSLDLYNKYYEGLFHLYDESQLPSGEGFKSPLFWVECARNINYRFEYTDTTDISDTLKDLLAGDVWAYEHYICKGEGAYVDSITNSTVNVLDDTAFTEWLKTVGDEDAIIIERNTVLTEEQKKMCHKYRLKVFGAVWMTDWYKATVDMVQGEDYTLEDLHPETSELIHKNVFSLDDEFQLYFDNSGHIGGASASGNGVPVANSGSSAPGSGWNVDICNINGSSSGSPTRAKNTYDTGVIPMYADWWLSDKTDTVYADVHQSTNDYDSLTETSTWIYAKYVMFNKPVYTFGKSTSGRYLATGRAYDIGSDTPNEAVYHAANTPIYLGTYSGSSTGTDNAGHFQDDGLFNQYIDNDGNAQPFVYNFWCPLSTGELSGETPSEGDNNTLNQADALVVTCHTVAINHEDIGGLGGQDSDGNQSIAGFAAGYNYNDVKDNNSGAPTRAHAGNYDYRGVVGRIGALTVVESTDPRYSDSFKMTDFSSNNIEDFLIYPLIRKIAAYSNVKWEVGSQRAVSLDPYDVRGRLSKLVTTAMNGTSVECPIYDSAGHITGVRKVTSQYKSYSSYNTYGAVWYKSVPDAVKWEASKQDIPAEYKKMYIDILPLTPSFNFHKTFLKTPIKVGYDLWLTLDSIGNYFGTSKAYDDSAAVNGNADNYQYKVQVRPFYATIDAVTAGGKKIPDGTPIDVYMRRGDTYVKVYSGCDAFDNGSGLSKCNRHTVDDMLDVIFHNYYPLALETNRDGLTADRKAFKLDQNMLRRSVTPTESERTFDVTYREESNTFQRSLLYQAIDDAQDSGITFESNEQRYVFGCSQLLQLRDRVRTYIGGPTAAINAQDASFDNMDASKEFAQKWYFGLGLPSSAVFVVHGEQLTSRNVLKTGFIALSVDVVANGDVWTIHYESDVSKFDWDINGKPRKVSEWNPNPELYPWLVPVTIYDIESTSIDDLTTQGSH